MSTWPLWAQVGMVAALTSITVSTAVLVWALIVYRRVSKQIDQATADVLDMRDHEQSVSNVRRLARHELHRRVMRNGGGDAS